MCEYEEAPETNILEFCNQNIQDAASSDQFMEHVIA
jgi:hypothetical protein